MADIPTWIYKAALEGTSVGVIITDAQKEDNPIIYANPRFGELTGYALDEILGKNCRFLQGGDSDKEQVKKIRESLEHGKEFKGSLLNYKKNGEPFWNRLTISPLRQSDTIITHFVGIQEDVTPFVNSQKKLVGINGEMTDFCSQVAHDLRDPLASIVSMSRLAEVKQNGLEFYNLIKKIESVASCSLEIVKNVLMYSLRGSHDVKETIDSNELLGDVLNSILPTTNKTIKVLSKLPLISGNRVSIYRLFQNIISNAVEYGGDKIFVDCKISNGYYQFSVRDNGKGIAREKLKSIFSVYYSKRKAGGLGLSMSKKIVALHGGKIWCESPASEGATFYFTLPPSE